MSLYLKSIYEQREQEISDGQKLIKSDLAKFIKDQYPMTGPIFKLVEAMNTIYRNVNNQVRFLQLMIEAATLNILEQPEPAPTTYDPNATVSTEDRKILEWIKKYMEHKPGEDKLQ